MVAARVVAGLLMPGDVLADGAVVSAVAGRASGRGPLTVVCRLPDGAEDVRVFADRFEVLTLGACD